MLIRGRVPHGRAPIRPPAGRSLAHLRRDRRSAFGDAILDFYQDAGKGIKRRASATAGRLVCIVESLAGKEPDDGRCQRIETLTAHLEELS